MSCFAETTLVGLDSLDGLVCEQSWWSCVRFANKEVRDNGKIVNVETLANKNSGRVMFTDYWHPLRVHFIASTPKPFCLCAFHGNDPCLKQTACSHFPRSVSEDLIIVKQHSQHYISVWQHDAQPHCWFTLTQLHSVTTVVPAPWVHISENPKHVVPQRLRPECGGDDDVAALRQHTPHKHRPSIDVGGCGHTRLSEDVMHPIFSVKLHLEEGNSLSFI